MQTFTGAQAQLIADTLRHLDDLDTKADGMRVSVVLADENFGWPIGQFTGEEGVWLFEVLDPPF